MYPKYFLITVRIIEILTLGIESKAPYLTALQLRKNPGNFLGNLRNANKSRMVPRSKVQYDQVRYEDSTNYVSKVVNDVSRSENALDFMNMSDFSSRKPTSNYAGNLKYKESSESNLNSNFNEAVKAKDIEIGKNIFENKSQKIPLTNQKDHKETKKYLLSGIKTSRRSGNHHLCMSAHRRAMDINYLYECRSKEFRNFACVGKDGKLRPCNEYTSKKQLYDQLCIKKKHFANVMPCNRPKIEGFYFPAPNRKGELMPCHGENLRICFRSGYGLVDCKNFEEQRVLSRKRRSVQGEKIDPRNVQCSNCEVDIIMEEYEDSTPKIDIKIRPLSEPIPHQKSIKGLAVENRYYSTQAK